MKNSWPSAANIVIGIINIALFVLWWSLIKKTASSEGMDNNYVFNSIAINISLLQATLFIVSLVIAVSAFVGYKAIKDAAEKKAEEATREYLKDNLQKMVQAEMDRLKVLTVEKYTPQEATTDPAKIQKEKGDL